MTTTFGTYKRVLMLGIDGMGAFNRDTDTPNMDALFAEGATTYTALASKPTISAQCWTSMLTGATPEVHGLTNDDMHPIEGLPTIFSLIRAQYPDAELAAYTHWSPIALQIITPENVTAHDVGEDDGLIDRLLNYLDDHDPKMLFIQSDSVDGAGHTHGYGTEGHLSRISHVDGLLGKLVDKYKALGRFDDTLFIVTADHGGTPWGGHGEWSDGERLVFLGVAGKGVLHGEIGEVCMRDFPAIALHALGVKAPDFNPQGWAAQMPVGIFPDAGVENRADLYPMYQYSAPEVRTEPAAGDADYIGNFLDESTIAFRQNFEDGIEDVTGKCTVTTESGIVKRYEGGVIGKYGEFGNGTLRIDGLSYGKVCTFAFWYRTTADGRWMDLFNNTDGIHETFAIAPFGEYTGIYVKAPDGQHLHSLRIAPESYEQSAFNLWTHLMFEVDANRGVITAYMNFAKAGELTVTEGIDLSKHFAPTGMRMGADQYKKEQMCKIVDDVMIIDGPAPVEALKHYYHKA